MATSAASPDRALQAFLIVLRTPAGTERLYVTAADLTAATNRALGQLATDAPDAEIVEVRHLAPVLTA